VSVSRRGLKLPPHLAKQLKPGSVKAGILSGATYPADTLTDARTGRQVPDPRAGMPVAVIAAALEHGSSQNHPRPFMQNTAAKHGKEWSAALVSLLKQGQGADEALQTVGQVMKEDIQMTVMEWPADNSEQWAAFKGFDHGLIQTGHLSRSIESEVENAG
jgi:hypothetical protein